jgi:hypothetical protein
MPDPKYRIDHWILQSLCNSNAIPAILLHRFGGQESCVPHVVPWILENLAIWSIGEDLHDFLSLNGSFQYTNGAIDSRDDLGTYIEGVMESLQKETTSEKSLSPPINPLASPNILDPLTGIIQTNPGRYSWECCLCKMKWANEDENTTSISILLWHLQSHHHFGQWDPNFDLFDVEDFKSYLLEAHETIYLNLGKSSLAVFCRREMSLAQSVAQDSNRNSHLVVKRNCAESGQDLPIRSMDSQPDQALNIRQHDEANILACVQLPEIISPDHQPTVVEHMDFRFEDTDVHDDFAIANFSTVHQVNTTTHIGKRKEGDMTDVDHEYPLKRLRVSPPTKDTDESLPPDSYAVWYECLERLKSLVSNLGRPSVPSTHDEMGSILESTQKLAELLLGFEYQSGSERGA